MTNPEFKRVEGLFSITIIIGSVTYGTTELIYVSQFAFTCEPSAVRHCSWKTVLCKLTFIVWLQCVRQSG